MHGARFQAPFHRGCPFHVNCDEAVINHVTSHTEHGRGYMRRLPTWIIQSGVFTPALYIMDMIPSLRMRGHRSATRLKASQQLEFIQQISKPRTILLCAAWH